MIKSLNGCGREIRSASSLLMQFHEFIDDVTYRKTYFFYLQSALTNPISVPLRLYAYRICLPSSETKMWKSLNAMLHRNDSSKESLQRISQRACHEQFPFLTIFKYVVTSEGRCRICLCFLRSVPMRLGKRSKFPQLHLQYLGKKKTWFWFSFHFSIELAIESARSSQNEMQGMEVEDRAVTDLWENCTGTRGTLARKFASNHVILPYNYYGLISIQWTAKSEAQMWFRCLRTPTSSSSSATYSLCKFIKGKRPKRVVTVTSRRGEGKNSCTVP